MVKINPSLMFTGACRDAFRRYASLFGGEMPSFPAADLDEMRQPIDFLGINIYKADTFRRGPDGLPEAETTQVDTDDASRGPLRQHGWANRR